MTERASAEALPAAHISRFSLLAAPGDRARLILFGLLALTAAVLKTPAAAGAAFAGAALLLALCLGNMRKRSLLRNVAAVNVFTTALWLIVPWTTPGESVLTLGVVPITREGLLLALLTTLRCNAVLFLFLVLAAPMGVSRTAATMGALGMPAKLVTLITLMARQILALRQELAHMREAAMLRGFEPRMNLHTYRTLAAFVSLLFLRAFMKSRRLEEALTLRGFSGSWPRRAVPGLTLAEVLLIGGVAFAAALLLLADRGVIACL
ncbi:energy-coupling factor transporter transmembrane protein EcfT [Sutterella sp.]|uniref:energy-coupling factor transporter transmembrane component T family protein n=1 Tax=Sutterella sp. TaxID=1981025 RepID=UPI0026DFF08F|nr:energy-coupling factor transporter transmembrane component T [Sutterella sp.]MDO5530518.1 energy-coupling factor transporter transmembrane component T [Sutterella sp.]